VTIDNPVDMNELTAKSGESPQKAEDIHDRSRTLGDIEGRASSPLKVYYTHFVSSFPSLHVENGTINDLPPPSNSVFGHYTKLYLQGTVHTYYCVLCLYAKVLAVSVLSVTFLVIYIHSKRPLRQN